MKKAIPKSHGGKRAGAGRPATGRNPVSAIRLPEELTTAIDKWAAASGVPSRSEAIRRLTELGLKVARLKTPLTAEAATRARELALRTLDKLEDKSAPEEERANRRQRLLKGPKGLR